MNDLTAWPITPTARTRAEHGKNNDSFFISAVEGEFVLRIYRNTADPSRVRDEHDLLGLLAFHELPFAVPAAVKSRDGDTLAVLETAGGPRLAALFHRIPGEPAALTVVNARLAGRALGQLDAALGRIDRPVRVPASLRDVHALVPDPIAALDDLDGSRVDPIRALVDRVETNHDALVASLPRQIIHGDFAFPNLLVQDGVVTGMVDFEFAGADFRASDLAGALYVTTVRGDPAARWQLLEALATGYRRALPLDPSEIAALPALMLRRCAIGIVHWVGRWRQGVAPREEPLERVERGARFAAWLDDAAPRVVATVAGAFRPR